MGSRHGHRRPSDADRALGEKLRLARIMAGRTQGELGEALGVSFQQVQKYEAGLYRIPATSLAEAAKRLERPLAWFFDAPLDAPPTDREVWRLAGMINRLPEGPARAGAIRVLEIIVASQAASTLAIAGE